MDFSAKMSQTEREWNDIFKEVEEKNANQEYFCPVKLSFRNEGNIKTFPNEQKLKEFITIKFAL